MDQSSYCRQNMSRKCLLIGRNCTLMSYLAFLLLLFIIMSNGVWKTSPDTLLDCPSNLANKLEYKFNKLWKTSPETLLEFPSNLANNLENIYFIETSNTTTLPFKAQCSIESAATNNPKSVVNVLLSSGNMEKKILDRLTSFKNVVFHKINAYKFLEGIYCFSIFYCKYVLTRQLPGNSIFSVVTKVREHVLVCVTLLQHKIGTKCRGYF